MVKTFKEMQISSADAWSLVKCGKGWWRLSNKIQIHHAMDLQWIEKLELKSFEKIYRTL